MNNNDALVAPPDKYFYTIDGKILTNIHQLSEYVRNCSGTHFEYHVGAVKNDFYRWIMDVFGLSELAEKIKGNYDRIDVASIIGKFISDYETNINVNAGTLTPEMKNRESEKQEREKIIVENNEKRKIEIKKSEEDLIDKKEIQKQEHTIKESESVSQEQRIGEKTVPTEKTTDETLSGAIANGKFKEFSDEELEKFTKFGVKDTETPANEKLDYLKTELNELRSMIKELRKTGKDMIIADLMLRVVEPKMAFYEYTKSQDDYEKIIQVLNDARREIDYAGQQTESNMADEVIKQLDLQRIMLKKDFTPKKMGVLGKIFKQSNQEV